MARVLNCNDAPLTVTVPGRKPSQAGMEELVWPPRSITMRPRQTCEVTDEYAELLLRRWEGQGLVALRQGESEEDAYDRGQRAWYEHMRAVVEDFREKNAQRVSQGISPLLPRRDLRALMKTASVLGKTLLAKEEHLQDELPVLQSSRIPDPLADDIVAAGMTPDLFPTGPRGFET